PEQEGNGCRGSEVAVGEQSRGHEWIATASLDDSEGRQEERGTGRAGDDGGGSPAEVRPLHEGEHEQRDPQGRAERAWQVECATDLKLAVRGNERERQEKGGTREWDIDEEDCLPAERVRQHAAKQYADHETSGAGAAPDRYRAVALWAFREGRVDQREGGGEDQGTTQPLEGAGGQQELGR